MLFGGSRSGKTFLHVRNLVFRALKAPGSRHVIFRFRLNHIKSSIVLDTFPKVMKTCFAGVPFNLHKGDLYVTFDNGSEIWFAGLDDKERTEKILGQEYITEYFNECSQIPMGSVDIALTRLAQLVYTNIEGREPVALTPRAYYDCNPPSKAHWTYKRFIEKRDPETGKALSDTDAYASFQINPQDNQDNLSASYLDTLRGMSPRLQKRFLKGEFADATPNQLFPGEVIDKWRVDGDATLPDMVRVVVAVDPSGSGDIDNADNDAIGIMVGGIGTDGNAYVLEDCTVKAGPATWGRVAVNAWQRHDGDVIVGEMNYGGAMVSATIKTAANEAQVRPAFRMVTATRGKVVRAEPFSALYEQGKIRHVGDFHELEDEITAFSTYGYLGDKSPNRADALFWMLSELFPGLTRQTQKAQSKPKTQPRMPSPHGWLG